jgi:hypothetical protein
MPNTPCSTARCPNFATAKGMCDTCRRKKERERSAARRGGYRRGPMTWVTEARDNDPDYTPTKHRKDDTARDDDIPGAGGLAAWE